MFSLYHWIIGALAAGWFATWVVQEVKHRFEVEAFVHGAILKTQKEERDAADADRRKLIEDLGLHADESVAAGDTAAALVKAIADRAEQIERCKTSEVCRDRGKD